MLENKSPQYLYKMFNREYMRNTRQAARMEIRQDGDTPDLGFMWDSFRCRAIREFNQIPAELKKVGSLKSFKTGLRNWIVLNIPIYP